ncbi:glycosyltransferase family 1 protein [Acinetobacter sp. MYb177]|jgi:glycosyltransferase involved in cell wall biosynthesis|uniref:glycosyltransferase family 1 protein n=1 Tax=unclassified Acinetobacter TaxID=196816 RepID=UPI0030A55F4E
MKILHSACFLRPSSGIIKQMTEEKQAADALKLNWNVQFFLPKGQQIESTVIREAGYTNKDKLNKLYYKFFAWFSIRIEYYIWLLRQKNVDIFLIRYSVHDIFQLVFLLIIKKPVFLVHHTLEEPELNMDNTFLGRVRYFSEKIIGKLCIKYSYGIVAVTNEILEYEKKRINNIYKKSLLFPNGISMGNILNTGYFPKTDVKKILFVASEFSEWHGLDLILNDIKNNKNNNFELHLVGTVLAKDLDIAKSDKRVILHGVRDRKFIETLANQCHVALGSFALERKNMKEACTLKVREYLSLGLPVYSGHIDVFPRDFRFYKLGEPSIEQILAFTSFSNAYERKEIILESKRYIDKSFIVERLYIELKALTQV